ncbi:Oidioi.mRNA.OKI2018_I69.PAR.g10018.t1.cds [Oikopleura dioica]|uniref:Oidioi.mRNA.OKI2018_I69.PAR.g10018.t1.cds n=1 Tax=Oikopleura dioica TaxID=34765 RepID=A0ABN7RNS2_OIKDI|nr:Oidioi.mRNA.OKI2018_I69.PAR.g10018.t1.cds [Oikopleura dioica]
MKEVPVPSKLGEVIFVDEIHRTDRFKRPLKIYFATEAISRFAVALPSRNHTNTEGFVEFMFLAKQLLSPLQSTRSKVIVRCDRHSVHKSEETKKSLEELGMEVSIYESTTFSKNIIPEQDARIGLFSKLLNAVQNDPSKSVLEATSWACAQYNHTLSSGNLAPVEIMTGRKAVTQEPVDINLDSLIDDIKSNRKTKRDAADKSNASKKKSKRLNLVEKGKATSEEETEIDVGQIIRTAQKWDKNDLDRLYRVTSIEWSRREVKAVKVNARNKTKPKTISFSAIDAVISQEVRTIQENLIDNSIVRSWIVTKNGLSVWEEAPQDHIGPRAPRMPTFDDSGISQGPPGTGRIHTKIRLTHQLSDRMEKPEENQSDGRKIQLDTIAGRSPRNYG